MCGTRGAKSWTRLSMHELLLLEMERARWRMSGGGHLTELKPAAWGWSQPCTLQGGTGNINTLIFPPSLISCWGALLPDLEARGVQGPLDKDAKVSPHCQSLPQAELFVRQRERPGLPSQAVAWPPRRSAGRRESGSHTRVNSIMNSLYVPTKKYIGHLG